MFSVMQSSSRSFLEQPNPEDTGTTIFRNVGKYLQSTRRNIPEDLNVQQHRQCTYNVTLRRVREIIVAVEKQ